jgi:hypothetical protein
MRIGGRLRVADLESGNDPAKNRTWALSKSTMRSAIRLQGHGI